MLQGDFLDFWKQAEDFGHVCLYPSNGATVFCRKSPKWFWYVMRFQVSHFLMQAMVDNRHCLFSAVLSFDLDYLPNCCFRIVLFMTNLAAAFPVTEMGSRYIVESGFYMTSFTATIFITGLVTAGVLLITLLISLAVMLQSCQSKHSGVIELHSINDYYSYCRICALHAELNNLQGYNLPIVCRAPAIQYVKGGQYATDLDSTMSLIEDHFSLVKPSDDGFDVLLIEIDDLFPSYPHSSDWFHRFNNCRVSDCMEEARNSKLKHVLRLYINLKSAGWPIILLSREPGTQRNVTTYHLISAGFRGWSSLMMREGYEDSIKGNEYILRERNAIEGKGFRIKSIISNRMDAVTVQDTGMRNFKLPDPLCDKFEHRTEIPVAPY